MNSLPGPSQRRPASVATRNFSARTGDEAFRSREREKKRDGSEAMVQVPRDSSPTVFIFDGKKQHERRSISTSLIAAKDPSYCGIEKC